MDDGRRVLRNGKKRERIEKRKKNLLEVAFTLRVISFVYSLVKTNKQTDGWTTFCVVHVVVIRVFFAINS